MGIAGIVAAVALIVCSNAGAARPTATVDLAPGTFAELSSGVVKIRGFSCSGVPVDSGTGFLVGRGVVMTARHVIDPPKSEATKVCRSKVFVDGRWDAATRTTWWYETVDPTGRATDLATLRLARLANESDHVFRFRNTSPRIGSNLSMIGYPLAHGLSITQGKLIAKGHVNRVPMLLMNLLGAEGASGSPIVTDAGNVVGVLQVGLGGTDAFGENTSGAIEGIDIASWWGTGSRAEKQLCRSYPRGGIPDCGSEPTSGGGGGGGGGSGGGGSATGSPPPSAPPAAAVWLLPTGYAFWVGAGTYAAATVAYQYAGSSCSAVAYSMGCWGVDVDAHQGCNGGLYVKVNLKDSSQNVIDTGIAGVPSAEPDVSLLLQGNTFVQGVSQFEISEIDCFNF